MTRLERMLGNFRPGSDLKHGRLRPQWPNGAPGKIRTPDPQIRSLVLYPAELPVLSAYLWERSNPLASGRSRAEVRHY